MEYLKRYLTAKNTIHQLGYSNKEFNHLMEIVEEVTFGTSHLYIEVMEALVRGLLRRNKKLVGALEIYELLGAVRKEDFNNE